MRNYGWRLGFLFLLASAGLRPTPAQTNLPATFASDFAEVARVINLSDPGVLEMAAASARAARLFGAGRPGLGWCEEQFRTTTDRGQAILAGLYLCAHGTTQHVAAIRRSLERDRQKRQWLQETVGTEAGFRANWTAGEQWRPLAHVLPSTANCRLLAASCLTSPDALVRRSGLFWGLWFPPPDFAASTRKAAQADRDPLNRRLAARVAAASK